MPRSLVLTHDSPEVCRVTFDNPPANLVDPPMILALQGLVADLETDPRVKVAVFSSAITGHFLGPYDMSQAGQTPSEPGPTGLPPWLDLTVRLSRLPVVSIAVIRGASRGVGNEFALACDLRFAGLEHALIDQPEMRGRVVPGGGAIARLPALIGRARALELILGSVQLDGASAERYGVVNRALPDRDLDHYVDALASDIAGYDLQTLSQAKALIDQATLPADDDLVPAYQALFTSAARLAR
jgi:enoyl-CoA hydratase/carnithine racemase